MRGYLRAEAKVFQWTVRHGVPVVICRLALLTVKLTILGTFLYASFWIAIYAAAFWFVMGMAELGLIEGASQGDDDDGWRGGHAGFGDYCGEYRVDAGRFDEQ